jgi:hypothetical protein
MALVTIDTGAVCAGGNHQELIIKVDNVEAYREWFEIDKIIVGSFPAFQTIKEAANSLIAGTKAPNIAAWKNKIKSKEVETVDGIPLGV